MGKMTKKYKSKYSGQAKLVFVMPISGNKGLAIKAEDEPVSAKTTTMTKYCQLEVMLYRSLKLAMVQK